MFHGFALASGGQFGFACFPDGRFTLVLKSFFLFFRLVQCWGFLGRPGSNCICRRVENQLRAGACRGGGFSEGLSPLPTTSSMILGEATLIEELDDLVSLREQIRPGLFAGTFALQINLALSFHFY